MCMRVNGNGWLVLARFSMMSRMHEAAHASLVFLQPLLLHVLWVAPHDISNKVLLILACHLMSYA